MARRRPRQKLSESESWKARLMKQAFFGKNLEAAALLIWKQRG